MLIKRGVGGGKGATDKRERDRQQQGERKTAVLKCANVCTLIHSLRNRVRRAAAIMSRGVCVCECARVCARVCVGVLNCQLSGKRGLQAETQATISGTHTYTFIYVVTSAQTHTQSYLFNELSVVSSADLLLSWRSSR